MQQTEEVRDKVVLVGLSSPVLKKEENADEDTMEELSSLVETAGAETVPAQGGLINHLLFLIHYSPGGFVESETL